MSPCHPTLKAWATALAGLLFAAVAALGDDPEGATLLQEARKSISAYHAGQPAAQRTLKVVYFIPNDRDPLPDHTARLERIMDDVSGFYRDGMRRFGLDGVGLPLEKKDGKLVIHLVRGKLPAANYHYDSGTRTAAEIADALKGSMDVTREHVLVLYALCSKEADGRYLFDAPYYGDGGSSNEYGFCHAADCELLDPQLLTQTAENIVFTEHYYPRKELTVAQFNTFYLGGIAHELGHGLGLPHDNGNNGEQNFGVSLMGTGNLHYREDLWSGRSPAFLSRASALLLASHPLITGSDRGRADQAEGRFEALKFFDNASALDIAGTVGGSVPPYAAIAYVWPVSAKTDHSAVSYPVVLKDGAFELKITGLRREAYHLKLTTLHVNGAKFTETFQLEKNDLGQINTPQLTAEWMVDRAEIAMSRNDPKAREFVGAQAIAPLLRRNPRASSKRFTRSWNLLRLSISPPSANIGHSFPMPLGSARRSAGAKLAETGSGPPLRELSF